MKQLPGFEEILDREKHRNDETKHYYGASYARGFTDDEVMHMSRNLYIGDYYTNKLGISVLTLDRAMQENGASGAAKRAQLNSDTGIQLYTEKTLPKGTYKTKGGTKIFKSNLDKGVFIITEGNVFKLLYGSSIKWASLTAQPAFATSKCIAYSSDLKRSKARKIKLKQLGDAFKLDMLVDEATTRKRIEEAEDYLLHRESVIAERALIETVLTTDEDTLTDLTDPSIHQPTLTIMSVFGAKEDVNSTTELVNLWRYTSYTNLITEAYQVRHEEDYLIWTP